VIQFQMIAIIIILTWEFPFHPWTSTTTIWHDPTTVLFLIHIPKIRSSARFYTFLCIY